MSIRSLTGSLRSGLVAGLWAPLLGPALLVLGLLAAPITEAQSATTTVVHIEISGTIDLGLAPFLDRVLEEAGDEGAAAVILDIDTPGGRLDAVLQMKDSLLNSPVPTIAFVNRTAFSAGALIALACDQIYMAPGGVMGAATPVDGAGNSADAKVISAVRKTFKSTAEVRGRDPIVAEAMVDPAVAIPNLVAEGELLTLTTAEAVETGYTDGVVDDLNDVLEAAGLSGATVEYKSLGLAERVVRFVTNPVVASLLITAGILFIVGDLIVAGFGPIGIVGIGMIGLFFWGHALAGLAGWEDLILVGIGLILLAVEVFLIPGFGVFGLLGLASLAGGFWLAMVNSDSRLTGNATRAGWSVAISMLLIFLGLIAILTMIPRVSSFGGLVLRGSGGNASERRRRPAVWLRMFGGGASLMLPPERGQPIYTAPPGLSLTGKTGTALTDLRPSGIALIDGLQTDVVTEGEYVNAGEQVLVLADEKYRRVVQRHAEGSATT